MSKPTKKEIKELQDHIRSLNSIILDYKEQNLAIGNERDKWRLIAETLWKHLSENDKGQELLKNCSIPNVVRSFLLMA